MNKNNFLISAVLCLFITEAQAQNCSNALEESVLNLPKILTQKRSSSALDARCIQSSMAVFFEWTDSVRLERLAANEPEIGHYGYCTSETQEKVERDHTPPCQSETYINVIQNAYTDVLECAGMDPKRMFAITAVESGFHVNTYSLSSQDIGIGQLIPQAITEVNTFWEESLNALKKSKKPACKNLRPLLKNLTAAPSEGPSQACSMMALPENPVRNLLYKVFLHQFNQKKMADYFNQSQIPKRLMELTGVEWSDDDLSKLQEVLVFLAYNAGFQGTKTIFENFLIEKKLVLLGHNDQFVGLYQQSIDYYLRAMDLQAQGYVEEAQELLTARQELYIQMAQLNDDKKKLYIPKEQFFAGYGAGAFGAYLVSTKSSNYLKTLLDRVEHIEVEMLQAPGACAPQGFLKGL